MHTPNETPQSQLFMSLSHQDRLFLLELMRALASDQESSCDFSQTENETTD